MPDVEALRAYVTRHFVPLGELAALAGVSRTRVADLVAAAAIPRPIYSIWPNGAFSSPIGGAHNGAPAGPPTHWYAPAAAWWIRRARGMAAAEAARRFEDRFVADFAARLAGEPHARLGYPQAYDGDRQRADLVAATARAEWRDWIAGGYAVCVRQWNAHHVIVKTCRRALVIELTDSGRRDLTEPELDALLVAMSELDAVMLPFAPHQRPHGTPGLWIDAILARYGLGRTQETTSLGVPDSLCA